MSEPAKMPIHDKMEAEDKDDTLRVIRDFLEWLEKVHRGKKRRGDELLALQGVIADYHGWVIGLEGSERPSEATLLDAIQVDDVSISLADSYCVQCNEFGCVCE